MLYHPNRQYSRKQSWLGWRKLWCRVGPCGKGGGPPAGHGPEWARAPSRKREAGSSRTGRAPGPKGCPGPYLLVGIISHRSAIPATVSVAGPISAEGENGFQVGRGDGDAAAVVSVPVAGQLGQVGGQRGTAAVIERLECLQGRPVPAAEERDELLGRSESPGEGALHGPGIGRRRAEQAGQVLFGAPQQW